MWKKSELNKNWSINNFFKKGVRVELEKNKSSPSFRSFVKKMCFVHVNKYNTHKMKLTSLKRKEETKEHFFVNNGSARQIGRKIEF